MTSAQANPIRLGLNARAALASVAAALVLLVLKLWATWRTGSVTMLGSLADTGLDLFASLVTLFSVLYAAQPADREHRFGHGKAEALAALFQVTLVVISALAIGWRSVIGFSSGTRTSAAADGIGVSVIAIVVTVALLAYQRSILRQTGSVAIGADHLHYQSDLMLNGAVIAALALDQYAGIGWVDPLFGIVIAAWLLLGAWRSASMAVDQLMDREWPTEKRMRLLKLARTHPKLKGVHDLRTRTSGNRDFVQFHIWVDPQMTVHQAHEVMDEVEDILHGEFPDIDIFIHTDPEGHVDRGIPPDPLADAPPDDAARNGVEAMKLAFAQIDAFAEQPFTGNPAVVIALDHWLDDRLLQAIAAEHNVAATAFYLASTQDGADYELRWFSPACEIDLCGHGTLASAHHILARSGEDEVCFATRKAGTLTVRRNKEGQGAGYALTLPALGTSPAQCPDSEAALGIKALEIESHRKGYHIFRLENGAAVRAVTPDYRALAALGMDQFIVTAEGEASDVVSRVFVPGAGIDEDHVTGSAHAALTPFWVKQLGRDRFSAFQASRRGGHVGCGLSDEGVVLSGKCVSVIEGEMRLP